jgi:hypothetical protein
MRQNKLRSLLAVFLAVLASAPSLHAQVKLVGHAANSSGTTTAPINTSGGNFAVICGKANLTASDSNKNEWHYTNSAGGAGGSQIGTYYAFDLTTSPNQTFSLTGGFPFTVMVFSHVASGPDQMAVGQGASYPQTVGPITPANANELVVGCDNNVFSPKDSNPKDEVNTPFTVVDLVVEPANGSFRNATSSTYAVLPAGHPAPVLIKFNSTQANGQVSNIQSFFSDATPAPFVNTTPESLPEAVVGKDYRDWQNNTVCLTTTRGVHPIAWSDPPAGIAGGITFNRQNGCFSGRASALASAGQLSLTGKDAQGHTVTVSTHLTSVKAPLKIAAQTDCPDGVQLTPYKGCNLASFISGGTGTYNSFTLDTHNTQSYLPEGLVLDPKTGMVTSNFIRGQGGFNPILHVKDSGGGEASSQVNFHINGDNSAEVKYSYPADSVWHLRVDNLPLDNAAYAQLYGAYAPAAFHADFGRYWFAGGMPINTVDASTPTLPVKSNTFFYSEVTQTFAPCDAAIEDTWNYVGFPPGTLGDSHILTLRTGPHPVVQELYQGYPNYPDNTMGSRNCSFFGSGGHDMFGGAVQWDLTSYTPRGNGVSGADAGGLCLTCTLIKVDELLNGPAGHPIRFTLGHTLAYHLFPATVQAGLGNNSCTGGWKDPAGNGLIDPDSPPACGKNTPHDVLNPMGTWFRLKASTPEPGGCAANPLLHNLYLTFKQNGVILADNGSPSFIGISGTQDWRWPDDGAINSCLSGLHGRDLEPVNIKSALKSWPNSYQTKQPNPVPTLK